MKHSRVVRWLPLFWLSLASPLIAAVPEDPNLCLVKVRATAGAERGRAVVPDRVRLLPGFALPYLNLGPTGFEQLTIDPSRSFAPFPAPAWLIDGDRNLLAQPGSGRIVAVNANLQGVFVAQPPNGSFRLLSGEVRSSILANVPALDGTLLNGPRLMLLRGDHLEQIPGSEWLSEVSDIVDAPALGSVAVVGHTHPQPEGSTATTYLYTYGGEFVKVARLALESHETSPSIAVLANPQGLLLRTAARSFFVPIRIVGGRPAAAALIPLLDDRLFGSGGRDHQDWLVRSNRDYIVCGRSGGFMGRSRHGLEKLGIEGLEPVPGAELLRNSRALSYEIPTRGLTALSTDRGLYLFDGERVRFLAGSEPAKIGSHAVAYDLPVIGRVLIRTFVYGSISHRLRLHELRPDGRLVELVVPLGMTDLDGIEQMPASRLAVMASEQGIFSIDPEGTIRHVSGSESIAAMHARLRGVIPRREEMIVVTHAGVHLVVDRRASGPAACEGAVQ